MLGSERITHYVEGKAAVTYSKPQLGGEAKSVDFEKRAGEILSEGYLALQAENAPTEFRNVELLSLIGCMDKKASNFKPYFVQADNTSCKY